MKLRYTNKSKEDLETAIVWYEKQWRWLGFEFPDCVSKPPSNQSWKDRNFTRFIIHNFEVVLSDVFHLSSSIPLKTVKLLSIPSLTVGRIPEKDHNKKRKDNVFCPLKRRNSPATIFSQDLPPKNSAREINV